MPIIAHTPPAVAVPYPATQRLFDLVGAVAGLVLASPLMILAALALRLDSPGPVLFRQTRIGRGGRPFQMLKFRSMVPGADPEPHRDHIRRLLTGRRSGRPWAKLEPDPRATRVGRLLRATSLDELPQLFNVVRGEMSLVGPRPALPYELDLWQPWHYGRLAVPPGITGLWQVEARGRADFDEMIRLDLEYIRRRSLWLDLVILFRTPWVAVHHARAS